MSEPLTSEAAKHYLAMNAAGLSVAEMLEQGEEAFRQAGIDGPMLAMAQAMSNGWAKSSKQRFCLTEPLAAMLATTRAPAIDERDILVPFDNFIIEVPPSMTSVRGDGPLQIFYARCEEDDGSPFAILIAARRRSASPPIDMSDSDRFNDMVMFTFDHSHALSEDVGKRYGHGPVFVEVMRYLVNACLYITSHRERIAPKASLLGKRKAGSLTVREPKDVIVSATFRANAKAMIVSRSLASHRQVLLHLVRGHWRNQACGVGRTQRVMKWIHPHVRGDETLGRIVAKTTTVGPIA
jgi:hypothetical protein